MPIPRQLNTLAAALVMCSVLAGGCDQRSPNEPGLPASPVQGEWAGVVTDGALGSGQLRFSASGLNTTAFGTFTLTFADPRFNLSGDVTATSLDAPTVDLFFRARGVPNCLGGEGIVLLARAVLVGDRLTGTYQDAMSCSDYRGGSFEATRR
jgi:hypothetical protein